MSPARLALPLMLCGLLAACATPREQCISRATSELRTTQAALAEARDNVARGYAVFRERVPYTVYDTCYRRHHAHGGLLPYPCPRTHYRTKSTPVPINVAEERRKIRALERQIPAQERRAKAGLAQCEVAYPA